MSSDDNDSDIDIEQLHNDSSVIMQSFDGDVFDFDVASCSEDEASVHTPDGIPVSESAEASPLN